MKTERDGVLVISSMQVLNVFILRYPVGRAIGKISNLSVREVGMEVSLEMLQNL